jgi:hypothetical protein
MYSGVISRLLFNLKVFSFSLFFDFEIKIVKISQKMIKAKKSVINKMAIKENANAAFSL